MIKIDFGKAPSLKHINTLTTQKGLYQHSRFNEPDKKFGYSIDDNARAIIVMYQYFALYGNKKVLDLAEIYYKYIQRSQMETGFFHNFTSSAGNFIDLCGSQDSQGRTIWALGYMAGHPEVSESLSKRAKKVMDNFHFDQRSIRYERAKAFALIGYYYVKDKKTVDKIAEKLVEEYREHETEAWHWFENHLTYSNAIMPYSLLLAYDLTQNPVYKKVALKSLRFLHQKCLVNGVPAPIGQKGWYLKGKKKAIYDQQVVDAADMVMAHSKAYEITGEVEYLQWAELWWRWFYGNNLNNMSLINPETHGCYDGLTNNGINLNQGAESIVCYLLSYLAMAKVEMSLAKKEMEIKTTGKELAASGAVAAE